MEFASERRGWWCYFDDAAQGFTPMPHDMNAAIEAHAALHGAGGPRNAGAALPPATPPTSAAAVAAAPPALAHGEYTVDLAAMVQTNGVSGKARPVVRFAIPCEVTWYAATTPAVATALSDEDTVLLELAYRRAVGTVRRGAAPAPAHVPLGTSGEARMGDVLAMGWVDPATGAKGALQRVVLTQTPPPTPDHGAAQGKRLRETDSDATVDDATQRFPPRLDVDPVDPTHDETAAEADTTAPTTASQTPQWAPAAVTVLRDPTPPLTPLGSRASTLDAGLQLEPTVQAPVPATLAVPAAGPGVRLPSAAAVLSEPSPQRLVFPSISTAIFMFDLPTAAAVACRCVHAFLAAYPAGRYPDLRVSLLDLPAPGHASTPTIAAFQAASAQLCAQRGVAPDPRFTAVAGDVKTAAGRGRALAIVNAANPGLGGGPQTAGFNRALFLAAGWRELQADTRARHGAKAAVGPAYDVALRPESPLRADGTRHVIHVVGPNMNPHRHDCLHGDYNKGGALLRTCYVSALTTFARLANLPPVDWSG